MSATTSPRAAPVHLMVAWPSASRASTVGRLKVTAIESLQFANAGRDEGRVGQRAGERLDGLESIAGDAQDDLVLGTKPAALCQRERSGDGDPTRGLAEA